MRGFATTVLAMAAVLFAGCSASPPPVEGCVPAAGLVPVCGFFHPEDMELLPDGRSLVISQMGAMDGSTPGSLVLFDTASETITRLPQFTAPATATWGAPGCDTPPGPAFSPHGIDLAQRADGAWQLLAVNHGGRESVELFEARESEGVWQLEWRGCVVPPAGTYMNDVAALPGGAFLVTHMFPRGVPQPGGVSLSMLQGMLGFDTGFVLRCEAASGNCSRLPGTDAPFPNGIQVDASGQVLYLNAYLAGEVRKIAIPDGRLLGTARIKAPDNSQWDASGELLVASHVAGMLGMRDCFAVSAGACGAAFEIVALDPETMGTRVVLAHAGAPMGAATVAQQVGDALYLGSFTGDRILRAPLPPR